MENGNLERNTHSLPHFRIYLCGVFRAERRVGEGYEVIQTAEWGGSAYPRQLLKALLCCPGRQGRREALIELLWPDIDFEQAVRNFNTATTKLRAVLRPARGQESLLVTEDDSTVYRVEGQPLLWVDADAGIALLKEAEQMGRMQREAFPLLEEAAAYFNRGMLLEGEEGLWVAGRRATLERARYHCRLWLAEAYERQGQPGQAEMILSLLLEEDPTDEDAFRRLLALLYRQGMTHQALQFYEQFCQNLRREGLEPTEATKALIARFQEARYHTGPLPVDSLSFHGMIPFLKQVNPENALLSPFTMALSQGIVLAVRALGAPETQTPFGAHSYQPQQKALGDILLYKRNLCLALHLHRTSTAQGLLQEVNDDIQTLEQLAHVAKGRDLYCVKEVLIGNHLLAAKIVKDQQHYEHAYRYANNAVRVAKSLEDGDLIATTKYTRGCVRLEWAQFGTVTQDGMLQLNKEKVQGAIRDFQDILDMVHRQRTPLHPQLYGFTHLQLARAYSLLQSVWDASDETNPLTLVEQAESLVASNPIEDAYTRLLITGTLSGLHWGAYHLNKTELFLAMGMQNQALTELQCLRQLTERTYSQDEIRNVAWSNVVTAEVLMALGAYPEGTDALKSALLACRSINSLQNVVTIRNLHYRLTVSSYGTSADVQEIGSMLKEWNAVI